MTELSKNHNLNLELAAHIISYVSSDKAATQGIQAQITTLTASPTLDMVTALQSGKELTAIPNSMNADILEVLSTIVDSAPAKVTRDNAVSDFVKRCNRAFKSVADSLAKLKVEGGDTGGLIKYPNLGRSVKDGNVESKWSVKELTYEPSTNAKGEVTGAKTKVITEPKSNNKGTPDAALEPVNKQQLLAVIAAYVDKLELDMVDVCSELLKTATTNDHTFTVKQTKVKAVRAA